MKCVDGEIQSQFLLLLFAMMILRAPQSFEGFMPPYKYYAGLFLITSSPENFTRNPEN